MNWLQAIPIIISFAVASIAYQQWRVAKQKLRLDLYNRRFGVYENTLVFYQRLSGGQESVLADDFKGIRFAFIKSFRESQFLFDDDSGVYQLLDRLHSDSFKITALHQESNQKLRDLLHEDFQRALKSIDIIQELEMKMKPYLNFHKI
nr:hypothetical protein [uncultured Deefgea sp.]